MEPHGENPKKAPRLRRHIAGLTCTVRWVIARMNELLVGYARVPREQQDLTSQRHGLRALGVGEDRIYVDHGLTDTNRDRPGLRLALAACRAGDTLVVTRLDRLARSLSDAEAVLVAARRHSRPFNPAARHAWTSSGDWR
jgi:hypothetical protein